MYNTNKKLSLNKRFFVISATIFLMLFAAVFAAVGGKTAHAYKSADLPTGDNVIVLHDGTSFDHAAAKALAIAAGYNDLNAMMTDATETGEVLTSKFRNKVVQFGKDAADGAALKWVPVYLSRSTEDKDGDGKNDAVLTLWLATDIYTSTWSDGTASVFGGDREQNFNGTNVYANTYDGSFIRHKLNGKTGWTEDWGTENNNKDYANDRIRTMVYDFYAGPLAKYVTTPSKVKWQADAKYMKNDPGWAPADRPESAGYTSDWLNDNVWLPSLYETYSSVLEENSQKQNNFTKDGGLWKVDTSGSSAGSAVGQTNDTYGFWLRSAAHLLYAESYYVGGGGVSCNRQSVQDIVGVRPAVHINLASVAADVPAPPVAEVTFHANNTKYTFADISGAFSVACTTSKEGATVKLLADAETTVQISIQNNARAISVTLDLNGYRLKHAGIYVNYDATFTLADNKANADYNTTSHTITSPVTGGSVTVEGGLITGGKTASVNINNGTFNMTGGTIAGNTSATGGGVYVSSSGTFNMTGGTVKDNNATNGGGVYVSSTGTFNMTGGSIKDNNATNGGGGVYVFGNENAIGVFKVSGNVEIGGNSVSNVKNNVQLAELDGNGPRITVSGVIAAGSKIGIYGSGELITGYTQDVKPSNIFSADIEKYACMYVSDNTAGTVKIGEHQSTATCMQKATCINCGVQYGDYGAHDYGSPVYRWSSDNTTCTATRYCKLNGNHEISETATATFNVIAPTCTEDGYTEVTAQFTDPAIPPRTKQIDKVKALGLSYGTPTYTWDGRECTAERVCTNGCGHKQTVIATVTAKVTAPTCTEDGYTTLTAKFDESGYSVQTTKVDIVSAKGHDWSDVVWDWPSWGSPSAKLTCKHDGSHVLKESATVTTVVTKAATCSSKGMETLTATVTLNGQEYSMSRDNETPVDSKAHGWDDGKVITQPTCTQKGVKTFTCLHNSAHTKTEYIEIDTDAHDWDDGKITALPTCTQKGVKTFTCLHNSAHTKTEDIEIDPNAHVGSATCTQKAICTRCGKEYGDALGHDYTGTWLWANDGKTADLTLVCGRDGCAHSSTKQITSTGVKCKEPTCTEKGETKYTVTYTTTAGDNSAAQKTFTDTKIVADIEAKGHLYGSPTYVWNGNVCTATRICSHDNDHKETETITATSVTTAPTCEKGGYDTLTATFTNTAFALQTVQINRTDALGHLIAGFAVVNGNNKYYAFDTFDLTGAEVYTHCARENCDCEGGKVKRIANNDITVTYYKKDGWLHCGDPYVTLKATVDGVDRSYAYSVDVGKRMVEVVWEYTTSPVSDENAWVWNEITSGAHFVYDGTYKEYRVRMRFTGADNDPDKDKHYYRASSDAVLVNNENDRFILATGTYVLNVNESKFSEYTFSYTPASIEVKPYEIKLNDADVYRWTLGKEQGSLLRDGYVKEVDGEYLYYANEVEGGKRVTRSVVRYRGENSGLSIMLNGGEIADAFASAYKRTSITYSGVTNVGAIGKYTAVATLELVDKTNYKYTGEIAVATDRGMTIVITENGAKAVITKEWYVAAINNGLLNANGGEYKIDDRMFGADVTAVVPKLEHGDENFDFGNISQNDKRIAFELFTDADLTKRIAVPFYRYNFGDYVNGSMPSGIYYVKASVTGVTDVDGVVYQDFTRNFTFEVGKATLEVTDGLDGKAFTHAYNGKVQLYGYGSEPTVKKPLFLAGADRIGIWRSAEYDKYYCEAYMTYHLARWHTGGAAEHEYVTVTQLNNTLGKNQAPREVDTYTVYYRINALNYNVYGSSNDKTFTVTIVKQALIVPSDKEVTYNGERHEYTVSTDAPYKVQGSAAYTGANENGYAVTLELKDADNYEWMGVSGNTVTVKLIINKAVYDMDGVTFGNLDVLYDGTEHKITVAGLPDGVTFVPVGAVEAGKYELTVVFTGDGDNYEAIPSKSVTLIIRAPQLVKPDENDGENMVVVTLPEGFTPDMELVVTKVDKDGYANYKEIAQTVNGEIRFVYDVSLKSNGVNVQPDGALTIRLRIPENLKGKTFKLFHLHGDIATETEYTVDGNYAVVTTDKLSEFIFVGEKIEPASDTLWVVLIVIMSLIIAAEIGLIVFRKARKNKASEGKA